MRRAGSSSRRHRRVERVPVTPVRRAVAETADDAGGDPAGHHVSDGRLHGARGRSGTRWGCRRCPSCAAALCRTIAVHPLINAAWEGDAVAMRASRGSGDRGGYGARVDGPGGAGGGRRWGSRALGAEIRRVAELARGGRLAPADTHGATVGISNTGSYGSEAGTPILDAGVVGDRRGRGDRAAGAGGGGRGRGAAGVHAESDVRSSRPGRGGGRTGVDGARRHLAGRGSAARLAGMKIVSLLPSATEIVYALGLGRRPRGRHRRVRLPARRRHEADRLAQHPAAGTAARPRARSTTRCGARWPTSSRCTSSTGSCCGANSPT